MRVLVSGAAGFLGRRFVEHHQSKGDAVYGVDNMSAAGADWGTLSKLKRMLSDAGEFFAQSETNFDLAYHFAAPVGGREKIEGDPLFNADSLRLDSLFFRWAVKHGGQAVYPSSSAVYGYAFQEDDAVALEEELFHPANRHWDAPDEMYGFTKLAGEVLAWKAAGYGLNTLCLRPFSGYGEGQSMEYPIPSIVDRARRRQNPLKVWGTGEQRRDFIHVDDLVGATIARLNDGVSGYQSMNIGTGEATSFNEIARMVAEIVGYEPMIENDASKPQGVSSRFCDPRRMLQVYHPAITLKDGLERVLRSQEHENRPT